MESARAEQRHPDASEGLAARAFATLAFAALVLTIAGCTSAPTVPADPTPSPATTPAEAGLVDVPALIPGIALDIRYATPDNFTGGVVDGYDAPHCYLLPEAADALRKVEADLRPRQLRLRVFDCYRPARAVRQFVLWAGDVADQRTKGAYYPNLDKAGLLGEYIAPVSGHSRGATLDLTLLQCAADGSACQPLDMGTPFDFFDPLANTDSPQVTGAQRRHRELLREAMQRRGFDNYPMEWWHYTYRLQPPPQAIFDVPLRQP